EESCQSFCIRSAHVVHPGTLCYPLIGKPHLTFPDQGLTFSRKPRAALSQIMDRGCRAGGLMLARIPKRADQHAQSFTKQCSESFYLDGRPLRNKTFPFWCHGGQVIGPEELVVE